MLLFYDIIAYIFKLLISVSKSYVVAISKRYTQYE